MQNPTLEIWFARTFACKRSQSWAALMSISAVSVVMAW